MKLSQLREHELERLDEISKHSGNLMGSIAGLVAGQIGGTAVGAAAGAIAGPAGMAIGAFIGQVAGMISGYVAGGKFGHKAAKGNEYDIIEWERKLKGLKEAQKFAIREYEKLYMTKETKTPETIRGLHKLDMKFVVEIRKIEKMLKRAIK
jgi:hypothetical protein